MTKCKKTLIVSLVLIISLGLTACFNNEDEVGSTGTVSGVLTNSHGNSLAEAEVMVGEKTTTTNQNGSFKLEEVATGSANLRIKFNDNQFTEREITVEERENNLGELVRVVFDPAEDYPVKDLSNLSSVEVVEYEADEKVNSYDLTKKSDGSWVGNFILPADTDYKILGREGVDSGY